MLPVKTQLRFIIKREYRRSIFSLSETITHIKKAAIIILQPIKNMKGITLIKHQNAPLLFSS